MSVPRGPQKETALILRTIRHGETSRVATLFGSASGRIAVLAKGARSGKAGASGAQLDPPALIEAVIHHKANRSVQLLGQVATLDAFPGVKGSLDRTGYAAVVLEALYRGFTDGETNDVAFTAALSALRSLEAGEADPRIIFWDYLLKIASALGFALDPSLCPGCGSAPGEIGLRNALILDAGGILCRNCPVERGEVQMLGGEAVAILRLVAGGRGLRGKLKYSPQAASEITAALLRHLKHHHPGYIGMQSLEFLALLNSPSSGSPNPSMESLK